MTDAGQTLYMHSQTWLWNWSVETLKQMTTSNSRCVSERVYVPYLAGLIPVLYRLDGVEKSALDAWVGIVISFSLLPVRPCWTLKRKKEVEKVIMLIRTTASVKMHTLLVVLLISH